MKAVVLPALIVVNLVMVRCADGQRAQEAPRDARSQATIANATEPGTRLVVSGRVLDVEGRAIANASIFVYQTDAKGEYVPGQSGGSDKPRLFAFLRSDGEGRYSYSTIKPGSYPNSRNPGHIHYEVTGPNGRERIYEIVFEGDSFISDQFKAMARDPFGGVAIVKAEPAANGTLRVTHDVLLK